MGIRTYDHQRTPMSETTHEEELIMEVKAMTLLITSDHQATAGLSDFPVSEAMGFAKVETGPADREYAPQVIRGMSASKP